MTKLTQRERELLGRIMKVKRMIYYGGLIPSQVFDEYEYQSFLKYASAYELENDIVTQETLDKMGDNLSSKIQQIIVSNPWNTYLKYR
jgi:hypothetical protein